VPKKFWFQNSLDAITDILNNERDYQAAKVDKQLRLGGEADSADVFSRQARRLRRLAARAFGSSRRFGARQGPVSIPVKGSKTCWVVCGPESSGSVLIAKTISHAVGASKQFSDYSGYGYNGEIGMDNLVLHRSIPFLRPKKTHVDLLDEIEQLKQGYNVINYILTTREPTVSIISKANRFGGTLAEGREDLEAAHDFFVSISKEPTCFIWSYETMQLLGSGYFERLYSFFEIESDFVPAVRDANSKYILPAHDISSLGSILPSVPIVFFLNLFLKDGALPDYVAKTVNALLNAINHAPTVDIKVAVMVDGSDFKFFKQLFKGYGAVVRVCKLGKDSQGQRLPKIRDILRHDVAVELLGSEGAQVGYCIYANADICVPTYFFSYIHQQLAHAGSCSYPVNTSRGRAGTSEFVPPDSFVINRRDVLEGVASGDSGDSVLAWHPGSDLFVFPCRFLPLMSFGDVTIGMPPIAPIIWLNLLLHSRRTMHIADSFITWHFGNDQQWRSDKVKQQIDDNTQAAAKAFWQLIGGDKSKIEAIRYEDSINARNLRSKASLFVSMAEDQGMSAGRDLVN
jgi:hypothetical protein